MVLALAAAWHVALSGGAGVAYGRLGGQVELGIDKFAVFAGAGYDLNLDDGPSWATGLRFLSGGDHGVLVSLNLAYTHTRLENASFFVEYIDNEDVYLGGTVGYRLTLGW